MTTATLVRPDGRTYRPKTSGLRAHAWENDSIDCGVIVFGTLDPEAAEAFALESAVYWYGEGTVTDPDPDWWRDGYLGSERTWIRDERRGAPGVMFTWVCP